MAILYTGGNFNYIAAYLHFPALKITDLALYDYIQRQAAPFARHRFIENKKLYFELNWRDIVENMPVLGLSTKASVFAHVKKLTEAGLLAAHADNMRNAKANYCFGDNADKYNTFNPEDLRLYIIKEAQDAIKQRKADKEAAEQESAQEAQKNSEETYKNNFTGWGKKEGTHQKKYIGEYTQNSEKSDENTPLPTKKNLRYSIQDNIYINKEKEKSADTYISTHTPIQKTAAQLWADTFEESLTQGVQMLASYNAASQSRRDDVDRYLRGIAMNMQAACLQVFANAAKTGAKTVTPAIAQALAGYYVARAEKVIETGTTGVKGAHTQVALARVLGDIATYDEAFCLQAIEAATVGHWEATPVGSLEQLREKWAAHCAQQAQKAKRTQTQKAAAVQIDSEGVELSMQEQGAIKQIALRSGLTQRSLPANKAQAVGVAFRGIYEVRNNEPFIGSDEEAQADALFLAVTRFFNETLRP